MYDDTLAHVYDAVYRAKRKDYRAEAAQIVRLVRDRQPQARTLLDVGCGTGEHLRHLSGPFVVQGMDVAGPMLERARAKLPGVPMHLGDMRSFDLGRRFDVVTCLFGAIGEVGSSTALYAAVRRLAAHLNPGGVLVLEPWYTAETWRDGQVSHAHAEADGQTIVRVCRRWTRDGTACLDLHYLIADAAGVRHRVAEHTAVLFTRAEYDDACRQAGVAVEFLPDGPSGRGLFVGTATPPPDPADAA